MKQKKRKNEGTNSMCPRWKNNLNTIEILCVGMTYIVQNNSTLLNSQIKIIWILKHFYDCYPCIWEMSWITGKVEELGY